MYYVYMYICMFHLVYANSTISSYVFRIIEIIQLIHLIITGPKTIGFPG